MFTGGRDDQNRAALINFSVSSMNDYQNVLTPPIVWPCCCVQLFVMSLTFRTGVSVAVAPMVPPPMYKDLHAVS